jgi:hypothetical protein
MLMHHIPTSSSGESDSETSSSDSPVYTPQELSEIFLDFYNFLCTLHYDVADLKIPPPEGWPTLTPAYCANFKTDYAIEVLRHLPYFDSKSAIHYKSALIDYSTLSHNFFASYEAEDREGAVDFESTEGEVDPCHVFFIAWGHESGGRDLLLNVKHGEIIEEMIRCSHIGSYDVKEYFDIMKEAYRSLKLIPCLGRITIEAEKVQERVEKISEEEIWDEEEGWGTDLDVQYLRQIYREYGWPDAFKKEEAKTAVDELMKSIEDSRGGWESEFCEWQYE